jgi:hypothetical protein
MAHDVFISYSSSDKAIAVAACTRLESNGVSCWIAPRDVVPGEDYGEAINSAIERARIMVLILSAHANASKHVIREVELAIKSEDIVIPMRIENVEPSGSLEYFLGPAQWLDAITPPIEAHLAKLVDTVRGLLGSPPSPPPPPPQSPPQPPNGPSKAVIGGVAAVIIAALVLAALALRSKPGSDAGIAPGPSPSVTKVGPPTTERIAVTQSASPIPPSGGGQTSIPATVATAQPSVPATVATAAQACQVAIGALFAESWASGLGCPTAAPKAVRGGFQRFERGIMVWRSDRNEIYTVPSDGESWERHPNRWTELPELTCQQANTPVGPVRGFGEIWCNRPDVRERLGGAQTGEEKVNLVIQDTIAGGHLLRITDRESLTVALMPDGSAKTEDR